MNEKKLRILLAEGDSGEAATSLREIYPEGQDGLELTVVSALSTLIGSLEIVNPEIIFLDLSLAQPDPLDAVRRVHRSAPGVPLIVLAGDCDKNRVAQCLSQGALDYLPKGFIDARALKRVLRAALERKTFEGLADLLRDPLTGLYTRDGFLTLGDCALETAVRRESSMVLLCMKIENLAALDAESGPSALDTAMCEVATLLAGSFRKTDILARLGKSQFAALAVDAIEPSAAVLCQRVERRLAVLNRERGARSSLELRLSARFCSPTVTMAFSAFLDSVERELRLTKAQFAEKTASSKPVQRVEK
jgi:diguanylate cyclase (GGDEF)-like protein